MRSFGRMLVVAKIPSPLPLDVSILYRIRLGFLIGFGEGVPVTMSLLK